MKRYKDFLAEQTEELKNVANEKIKKLNEYETNKKRCLDTIFNIIYH